MKLVLGCTYACQDNESNGATLEMDAALKLPVKRMTSRLTSMATSNALIRLTIVPLVKIQFAFMGESGITGLAGQKDACVGHDALSRLQLIQSPTLVMVGTGDRVIKPTSSEVLAKKIPKARLTRFDNGSHMFSMDMRKRFNKEVLDFLKNG